MVVIKIDGEERKDYEIAELLIIGDDIKIAIKKKEEQTSIINFNTGLSQQSNNPILEINSKSINQPQILCEKQAYLD